MTHSSEYMNKLQWVNEKILQRFWKQHHHWVVFFLFVLQKLALKTITDYFTALFDYSKYSAKIIAKFLAKIPGWGSSSSSHSLFQWAVLTCGHCFCNECIAIIVEQYSVGSRRRAIKCAICRQTTSHTEISYVFTAQSSSQDQDIPVRVSQKHGRVRTRIRTHYYLLSGRSPWYWLLVWLYFN